VSIIYIQSFSLAVVSFPLFMLFLLLVLSCPLVPYIGMACFLVLFHPVLTCLSLPVMLFLHFSVSLMYRISLFFFPWKTCPVMSSCFGVSFHVLSRHVLLIPLLSYPIVACFALSCSVIYCTVLSCHTSPCPVLSSHVLLFPVSSCLVLSCIVLKCLPYHTYNAVLSWENIHVLLSVKQHRNSV
jgi:hypothetical protein